MSATELVNLLEERNLVAGAIIAQLRGQIQQSPRAIPPAQVIKVLVDRNLLSPLLAQQLTDEFRQRHGENSAATPALADTRGGLGAITAPTAKPTQRALSPAEDLGLAPMEGEKTSSARPAASSAKSASAAKSPPPSGAKGNAPSMAKAVPGTAAVAPGQKTIKQPAAAKIGSELDDLDAGLGGNLSSDPLAADPLSGVANTAQMPGPLPVSRAPSGPNWLLVGGLAGMAALLLGGIIFLATRGDETTAWNEVKKLYDQNDATAGDALRQFVATYPQHPQVGAAQVYLAGYALAEIPKANRPLREKAQEIVAVLRPLAVEPAITEITGKLEKLLPDTLRQLLGTLDPATVNVEQLQTAGQLFALYADARVIPYEKRNWPQFDLLEEQYAQLLRASQRNAAWRETRGEVEALLKSGQGDAARGKAAALLNRFPELAVLPEWKIWQTQLSAAKGSS
ncbi:MAG: hypothetical protein SFX18_19060 [Pirellulales bacterium]|nr:hypothetical protein [Pirellulales bacterium]